jgi:hypothetical protein
MDNDSVDSALQVGYTSAIGVVNESIWDPTIQYKEMALLFHQQDTYLSVCFYRPSHWVGSPLSSKLRLHGSSS